MMYNNALKIIIKNQRSAKPLKKVRSLHILSEFNEGDNFLFSAIGII